MLFGIRRRPDLSPEEFWAHWHGVHANLARELSGAIGQLKYVQNRGVHPEIAKAFADERGGLPPFDGFAEAWFESVEALAAARESPEGLAAFERFLADEHNFLDIKNCSLTIVEEHPIIGPPTQV